MCNSILYNVPVGIKNMVPSNNRLVINPNPVNEDLIITGFTDEMTGRTLVTITNLLGQAIWNKEMYLDNKAIIDVRT